MTNATVSSVMPVEGGRDLQLSYQRKVLQLMLPDDAAVVTFARVDQSHLKAGSAIFAVPAPRAGGSLHATSVSVEKTASSRLCSAPSRTLTAT
jgi:hypothetical protein